MDGILPLFSDPIARCRHNPAAPWCPPVANDASPRGLTELLSFDSFVLCGTSPWAEAAHDYLWGQGKEVLGFFDPDPETRRHAPAELLPLSLPRVSRLAESPVGFMLGSFEAGPALAALRGTLGISASRIFPLVIPDLAGHYLGGWPGYSPDKIDEVRRLFATPASTRLFDLTLRQFAAMDLARSDIDRLDRPPAPLPAARTRFVSAGERTPALLESLAPHTDEGRIIVAEASLERLIALKSNPPAAETLDITYLHAAPSTGPGIRYWYTDHQARAGLGDLVPCDTIDRLSVHVVREGIDHLVLDLGENTGEALIGARSVLRRQRPVVTVAACGLPDHLWEIPFFLASELGPMDLYALPGEGPTNLLTYHAVPRHRAKGAALPA
ncbi:MAG: hypothetical protein AAGH45_07060 [Pseudomonadota bacterium]